MPGSHMVYTGNIVFESENRKRKERYTLKNIVLIGMPGAGKSTVGVVIAKKLGYRFMDSDLVIQERTGKMLHEIIEEKGTEGFLTVEGEINAPHVTLIRRPGFKPSFAELKNQADFQSVSFTADKISLLESKTDSAFPRYITLKTEKLVSPSSK